MQATLATNNTPPMDSTSSAILYFARTSWYNVFTYLSECMLSSDLLTIIQSVGPGGFTCIIGNGCYQIEAMILPRLKIKEPTPPFILDK
jgi:hypothetical protein